MAIEIISRAQAEQLLSEMETSDQDKIPGLFRSVGTHPSHGTVQVLLAGGGAVLVTEDAEPEQPEPAELGSPRPAAPRQRLTSTPSFSNEDRGLASIQHALRNGGLKPAKVR